MAEALGKAYFPTMLSGVLRGRRKGDPNTSVVGNNALNDAGHAVQNHVLTIIAQFGHAKPCIKNSMH